MRAGRWCRICSDLHRLYQVLAKAREQRGAIDFETVETRMEFDEQGKITRIVPVQRNDAHRLIEECMLAANVCASDFLQSHEHPALYRIHEGPTPEKLAALREFLREFGLQLGGGDEPHAKDYAKLLEQIRGRPDYQLLQTVLLRSLRQAVYSPENVGHFGLAYEAYTHFTSPIRRYPDLLVHRAIKAVLAGETYEPGQLERARRALLRDRAPRRRGHARRRGLAQVLLHARPHRRDVQRHHQRRGRLRRLRRAGRRSTSKGLVHVSELGNDYFQFDAPRHQLLGERTRQALPARRPRPGAAGAGRPRDHAARFRAG